MADLALPTLLALASHELRGPTGVVRGYVRMLDQDGTLGERPRRILGEVGRATDRLAALLDQMSELAHLQDGRLELVRRSRSLRAVLTQAAQSVVLPDQVEATITVRAPADVRMRLDEARLQAAIATLIITVARAQPGPAALELQLTRTRAGARIVLQPQDATGRKVVERPVDLSRGGTGLALPIADTVIRAHGGRLRERWAGSEWLGFGVARLY